MVPMQKIQFHKKAAVYPQLADHIKRGILFGEIVNGEEMPSRRELALALSINPNTVQKAYKILEDEGVIRTISNVASVAVVNDEIKERIRSQLIEQQLRALISDCKACGMDFQKTITMFTALWDEN